LTTEDQDDELLKELDSLIADDPEDATDHSQIIAASRLDK